MIAGAAYARPRRPAADRARSVTCFEENKMEDILTAISTVGFPIVCCLILGYLLIQEQNAHKEESTRLVESINNNTLIMRELKQLIYDIKGVMMPDDEGK